MCSVMVMIICIVDDGDYVDAGVIFPDDDGDDPFYSEHDHRQPSFLHLVQSMKCLF